MVPFNVCNNRGEYIGFLHCAFPGRSKSYPYDRVKVESGNFINELTLQEIVKIDVDGFLFTGTCRYILFTLRDDAPEDARIRYRVGRQAGEFEQSEVQDIHSLAVRCELDIDDPFQSVAAAPGSRLVLVFQEPFVFARRRGDSDYPGRSWGRYIFRQRLPVAVDSDKETWQWKFRRGGSQLQR